MSHIANHFCEVLLKKKKKKNTKTVEVVHIQTWTARSTEKKQHDDTYTLSHTSFIGI